jgi:hypothetical protein
VCHSGRTPFFDFLLWFSSIVLGHIRLISGLGSLRCRARHWRPCFVLFLFSLACFWLSVSLSYPWAKGDILDSDSSDDLMSGASRGTNSYRGRRIMNTSRVWSVLLLMSVSILSESLRTLVDASAS